MAMRAARRIIPSAAPPPSFQSVTVARPQVRTLAGPYGYTQAKALVFSEPGEPQDVLKLHTHSISPTIPSSSVLLRTLAAPINPADVNTVQGTYGSKPAFSSELGTQPPSAVPGNEGVFEVVKTGSADEDGGLKKGDWVLPASPNFGTWRTHALVDKSAVLRIDRTGLSPVQAATVSVNPCTAYRMLRSFGPQAGYKEGLPMRPLEVGSGQWFIQNGANSGVGRAAIQLGKMWGLRSINVVRERATPGETQSLKEELTALGATHVFTDAELLSRDFADKLKSATNNGREPVHLALNCVGGKSATALARSLAEGGTMVTYGGMAKQPVMLPVGALIFKNIRFLGFWLSKWNQKDPEGRRYAVEYLLDLIRKGEFKDVPVEEVPWSWETEVDALRGAAGRGLEGQRGKKGVFVLGET